MLNFLICIVINNKIKKTMKKTLLTIVLAILSFAQVYAQNAVFTEDFEGATLGVTSSST
jgi:hypothetical protein